MSSRLTKWSARAFLSMGPYSRRTYMYQYTFLSKERKKKNTQATTCKIYPGYFYVLWLQL